LVLEGKEGGTVEINWPIQTSIDKNLQFFLGITQGVKAIRSIQVTFLSRGRQIKQMVVLPNQAFPIKASAHEVDGLKIRMTLHKNHFRLKLKEMALFQPVAVTPSQALDIPILYLDETPLMPKDVISSSGTNVSVNQGNLRAIIFPETNTPTTISWKTYINRKVSWFQNLKINYQVPQEMTASGRCWLQLTLMASENQIHRTVCPQLVSGQYIFSDADLFRDTQMPSEEVIKFITWSVNFEDQMVSSKQPLIFNMAITLTGTNFRSFRNEVIQNPVLELQGQKIFPTALAGKTAIDLLSGRNLVNLGQLYIQEDIETHPTLKIIDHPHLDAQTIILKKSDPISPKTWAILMEIDQNNTSPAMAWLLKLFPPLMVFAVLWWGWKKKWHKFIWKWGGKWSVLFWKRIMHLFQKFPRVAPNKWFLLNRWVGFTILGSGLLVTGWIWEDGVDFGSFALVTIIGLFLGVLWHELRWWVSAPKKILAKTNETDDLTTFSPGKQQENNGTPLKNWFFGNNNEELPPLLYLVAAFPLGWVSFNLGFGNDLITSLLPPLGVFYFYIPWLPWFFKGKIRFWITTATGLYLMGIFGLIIKWKGGAEFFFSIAGISAVLVWKNLAPHLRQKLEQRWPSLSDKVYKGAGTHYIAGFLLTLVIAAFFLIIRLEPVAEQIAVVGYFMLVVGVFLEIKALRNINKKQQGEDESIDTETEATRA